MGRNNLIEKGISFIVFVLFIGLSIIVSSGIIVLGETSPPIHRDDFFHVTSFVPAYSRTLEAVDNSKELFFHGKTAYAFNLYCPYLIQGFYSFSLNDPGDLSFIQELGGADFLSGGTWTNDGRWLCCYYGSGHLCEVDPKTGSVWIIGGGGTSLNGLAYNPVNNKLYGAASFNLYEINIKTGKQTYIGDYGNGPEWMIGIACNADGVLYGWDIGNDSLWTIDIDTGEATLVGPLGINLHYQQGGHFDMEDDILYLAAFTESPNFGGYLYECDEDTGNCNLIGQFEGGAELDAFAIPYNWSGPTADFTWIPSHPNPDETTLFNASDSYDPDGYITLYDWDWDNDGIFDESHTSPTATHSWPSEGYYPITLKVTDNTSLTGMKTKTVRVGNQQPTAPIITGPTFGRIEIEYIYNFSLSDPDNDPIYLRIDWGNGIPSAWQGLYDSDIIVRLNHTWNQQGNFIIRAQTKDIYGEESDWGTLTITMPRNKAVDTTFLKFLQNFPHMFALLRHLLHL